MKLFGKDDKKDKKEEKKDEKKDEKKEEKKEEKSKSESKKEESKNDDKKDSKSLPAVPDKTKTPVLPSKDKKPPPKVPTAKDKKPAPTIPSKPDKAEKEAQKAKDAKESESSSSSKKDRPSSVHGSSKPKKKASTLTEAETLRAQVGNLEAEVQRLKKANADLEKKLTVAGNVANAVESEQAKNILSILARVNSANEWMSKVKSLDPLLGVLAELKQFQATAAGTVAHNKHVQQMKDFDDLCAKYRSASGPNAAKLEKECALAAESVYNEFAAVDALQKTDKKRLSELIDSVDSSLSSVAPAQPTPKQTPPHAISKVVTDFNAYKKDFELTVIPAHDKIAAIIADLESHLAQSARMNTVVDDASNQFDELFANAKYFVESQRALKPDPEFARLEAHYLAQLASLQEASALRAEAAKATSRRTALEGELREAKKTLRSAERSLEDLRDDGKIVEGSKEETKMLDEIAKARANLVQLESEDAALAAIATSSPSATSSASAPTSLTARKLDGAYTYSALADGVLLAQLVGDERQCVLKVSQKPPDAELERQLGQLGRLGAHGNLVPVAAAFVDGPHLYVHMPYHKKGNVDAWLAAEQPPAAAVQRALFGALSALAHVHARGAVHGGVRPAVLLIDDDSDHPTGVRGVLNSYWGAASEAASAPDYAAPESAGGAQPTAAADLFAFGLLLLRATGHTITARKAAGDKVSLPKIKDKQLAQLVGELVDSDPSKRPSALKALEHAYFADQYTTLDALKDSSKNLRAARNALAALGKKTTWSSDDEEALRLLDDPALFARPHRLVLPTPTSTTGSDDAAAPATEGGDDKDKKDEKKDEKKEKKKEKADAAVYESVGKALLHSMLTRRPLVAPLAPVLLKYLLGVLPSSVRDLLRDLDQFDPARARYYRHVRLLADVNELSLTMADGSPVTNSNREQYLKESISNELIDTRKPALEALRKGFFALAGVKDELRKLKASELAVLLAGEDYLSGEELLARTTRHPADAKEAAAFEECVRQLAADDLRRVLFGATGAAGGFDQLSVFFRAGEQCEVSFDCNFARIDVVGDKDIAGALGNALSALDRPLLK